jgi:hypothetical protein
MMPSMMLENAFVKLESTLSCWSRRQRKGKRSITFIMHDHDIHDKSTVPDLLKRNKLIQKWLPRAPKILDDMEHEYDIPVIIPVLLIPEIFDTIYSPSNTVQFFSCKIVVK